MVLKGLFDGIYKQMFKETEMKNILIVLVALLVLVISAGFARYVAEPNDIQVSGEVTSQWVNSAGDTILLVAVPESSSEYSPALVVRVVLKNDPAYSWIDVAVGDQVTVTGTGSGAVNSNHNFTVEARKLRRGNQVPQ